MSPKFLTQQSAEESNQQEGDLADDFKVQNWPQPDGIVAHQGVFVLFDVVVE